MRGYPPPERLRCSIQNSCLTNIGVPEALLPRTRKSIPSSKEYGTVICVLRSTKIIHLCTSHQNPALRSELDELEDGLDNGARLAGARRTENDVRYLRATGACSGESAAGRTQKTWTFYATGLRLFSAGLLPTSPLPLLLPLLLLPRCILRVTMRKPQVSG